MPDPRPVASYALELAVQDFLTGGPDQVGPKPLVEALATAPLLGCFMEAGPVWPTRVESSALGNPPIFNGVADHECRCMDWAVRPNDARIRSRTRRGGAEAGNPHQSSGTAASASPDRGNVPRRHHGFRDTNDKQTEGRSHVNSAALRDREVQLKTV